MLIDKILTLSDLKVRHILLVLDILRRHDGLSRIELARMAGCDNTMVTRAVRDLMARGLVVATGKSDAARGRPRVSLSLNPEGPRMVGIALEPASVTGAIVDLHGRIRLRLREAFGPPHAEKSFFSALEKVAGEMLAAAGDSCLGVGVSTFGAGLDAAHLDFSAHIPELHDVDVSGFFKRRLGVVPEFADTLSCRMQYELSIYPELRKDATLLVWLGGGIGMNLAISGRLLPGHQIHGGELGHNVCEPDGLPCACGRRGCLETRCSTGAVLSEARRVLDSPALTFRQLATMSAAGEPRLSSLMDRTTHLLSIALANQLNNLNIKNLVLAGELLQLGKSFRSRLESEIRSLLFPAAANGLRIHFRQPDDDGLVLGASFLIQERLFTDPRFLPPPAPSKP